MYVTLLCCSYAKLAGWSVDLVTKGFQVRCQLVQDLECDVVFSTGPDEVIPFTDQLDIFGSYTPWHRIRMLIIASIPLVDVLFTLLCSSYKKVYSLCCYSHCVFIITLVSLWGNNILNSYIFGKLFSWLFSIS